MISKVSGRVGAHPADYAAPDDWQENAVRALQGIVPPSARGLLSDLLAPQAVPGGGEEVESEPRRQTSDTRRLGF